MYVCKFIFNSPYPIIILNFILFIYFCDYSLKIIEREEKKLKYKGKYVKKDAIRKWLKRHNNEFNSKWTEEEKLIAEEIIKKWNSK